MYVSDHGNSCIRKVTNGAVSTLCGSEEGNEGFADGQGADARFRYPAGLALDTDGDLIVADKGNNCIRKVALADRRVTTVAGSRDGGHAGHGFADGEAAAARFYAPDGVAVDGNNAILVADVNNNRVRMIAGSRVTTLAGSTGSGKVDGEGASARFAFPSALALDERGRLLVADYLNWSCLRVVEASLAPPKRLAVEPVHNLMSVLSQDLGKLLEDTELADVTFAVDSQRFPALSAGGEERLLQRLVQVGAGHA